MFMKLTRLERGPEPEIKETGRSRHVAGAK